jgi:hypothetical protein
VKIEAKILEVMKAIPSEQELGRLNEVLVAQKLISKTEYEVIRDGEKTDKQGVVWQIITVSCQLTIVDTESEEILVNNALGTGIDSGDMTIAKAQEMARKQAWRAMLNIFQEDKPAVVPEIVVETPEEKLRAEIRSLWRWDPAQFPDWVNKRVEGSFESADVVRLTVVRDELKGYRNEHG